MTIAGNFIGTNPAGTAEGSPGGGFGIRLRTGDNSIFGGPAAADRNLIAGDGQGGIHLNAGNGTLIQGNYIGTDVTGTVAINGIVGREGIGGNPDSATTIVGNLISGNSSGGVKLGPFSAEPGGGFIQGNLIGTQRDGISPLGNNFGVHLSDRTVGLGYLIGGTSVGEANTIAFNDTYGVIIQQLAVDHGILGNSIFGNGSAGISSGFGTPLANDPCDSDTIPGNLGQNYPVITSAPIAAGNVTISGTLNSTASTNFRLEFFSNLTASPSGNGEGKTFLGFTNVMTDASCDASFGPLVFPVPSGQTVFAATATDPSNNTSEFSVAFTGAAPSGADLSLTKTVTPDPVAAGGLLSYAIGVANAGPSATDGVFLSDSLPANTTFVAFAAPAGWTPVTPPVGGTGTVTASDSLARQRWQRDLHLGRAGRCGNSRRNSHLEHSECRLRDRGSQSQQQCSLRRRDGRRRRAAATAAAGDSDAVLLGTGDVRSASRGARLAPGRPKEGLKERLGRGVTSVHRRMTMKSSQTDSRRRSARSLLGLSGRIR